MRVFIAIDIDEGIKKALVDLQNRLQRQLEAKNLNLKASAVKWVRPEAMHLTLKFLGEVKDEKVGDVCNTVKDVAGRNKSFELDIESVGYFGGRGARVLWVGAGNGCDSLLVLQRDLECAIGGLGLAGVSKDSREFSGHLTVCRVKNSKAGVELAAMSKDYRDFKLGIVSADSVSVYQSQLTPRGPVYILLGNYKLS